MNRPEIAMSYYRASLPICRETDLQSGIMEVSIGMAELFKNAGKFDSAQYYAKLSLGFARNGGFKLHIFNGSNFLASFYEERHNVDSAFVYMREMIAVKDSLFNEERLRQAQMLSFQETLRQQQIANEQKLREQERKQNIQYAIVGICVVTFILIFLLLSRSVIVNEKWIRFLGVLGLLLVFEFINLWLHPFLGELTHHSPALMLLIMAGIASLLIPLHHRIEHYITHKMTLKNRRLRLAAAKKTLAELQETEAG